MTAIKIDRYCLCGATLHAKTSANMAAYLNALFDRFHCDLGCGPATPAQAAAARRREDALALRGGS